MYEGISSDDLDLIAEKPIFIEKNGKNKSISYCLLSDSILFWVASANKKTPTKSPGNLFGRAKVYGLFKLKDLVLISFLSNSNFQVFFSSNLIGHHSERRHEN